jgi:ubiquinone/menaquinone biosynthesis C-methylase UbiE
MRVRSTTGYSLGSEDHEIARLDMQAALLERATGMLLRAAGIVPGMRVLDLGTGLGHVALATAGLVGAEGCVVGIDSAPKLLHEAARRASSHPQVRFVEGDVRTWRRAEPFDAVVGRLILFHLPDRLAVLRHHVAGLRRGGLVVALDFDLGASRVEPPVPIVAEALEWTSATFLSAGACPTIGARLAPLLSEAGLVDVESIGVQEYFGPDDPRGTRILSGVMRSLAPQAAAAGIVTPEHLRHEAVEERLTSAMRASGSTLLFPVLSAAWGRRPGVHGVRGDVALV